MRKGFTFVEIILVIVITPFVFLLIDGLFKAFISEIPWTNRIIQENTNMLSMLAQIQKDTDNAKNLPKTYAGLTANDKVLLIELPDGVICYQLEDGYAARRKLTDTGQDEAEESRVWSIPHGNVEWKVWTRNGRRYAVETNTRVEYIRRGQLKKKMAHSHLYFAGALGKEPESK